MSARKTPRGPLRPARVWPAPLAIALWGAVAWAEPAKDVHPDKHPPESRPPTAAQLFKQGRAAYDAQDYSAAAAAFQASYELSKKPELLFNIAQALRRGDRCEQALSYYDRYRDTARKLPNDFDDLRSEAERCAESQREAPTAQPSPAPEASAEPVPSEPEASSPPAIPAPPPPHPAVEAVAPPQSASAARPPSTRRTQSSWNRQRWLGVSSLAIGAGTGVLAVVFAVDAARAADATAELSARGGRWSTSAQANERSGSRFSSWSIALFATSAVATGAGLWLVLRAEPRSSAAVALVPNPSGAALNWRATF